ncbi:putative 26S proteasome regulatory subunit S3 [Tripterygium wilfordii]|uniref:COP9 signalosome complex subunit 3 n=1 Tax=Tripterygium wilfordii TaxID=458696 RepID=A0A7J7DKP8_TRIWF|nr:COP9 signalosome complex subunit 3 [Tripterygium wilfordii]KAF5746942.1 putative 26S proteasome regulatory subunit S3 [Tripterygium wilfordii]
MNAVEALVAQIQGLSGSVADLSHLHNLLKQADDSLLNESTRLLPFLDQLDPSKHSLGYLFILRACSSGPISKEQAGELVLIFSRFISSCAAEQIRLAPEKFISVCKRFKDQVMLLEAPLRGVGPMLTAVRKLQSSSEHLTALHPDFLQLALLAKCYKTGLSVLEDDIFEVDQPRDLFLYCYYGGMICIGQKCYKKALELLHNAVTAPMSTVNAIAVEAYKKYVLISLILNGQFSSSLPKYSSSVAQRNLKNLCQPYIELATSYSSGKISELETFVQTNEEKFESDNNLGLVKQVVSSMYKRNIQRLTQTYLTLSLQDIANTVQLNSSKEAEIHVLQMIQDGEIYATINQKDGMVRFLEDPEQYKTCEMIEHIDSSIQRIMVLSNKLTAMDEHMSCDPLYLAKAGRERQRYDFDDFDTVPQRFNI